MPNKYLYAFTKDGIFRTLIIVAVTAVVLCAVVLRLKMVQTVQLQDIRSKQAVISQIPDLKAKIAELARSVDGLILNGIIATGKQEPTAIINNVLVKAGDQIDGKRVASINAKRVVVCADQTFDKCIQLMM